MKILLEKAKTQIEQNLPFVVYQKPNEATVFGVFQNNATVYRVENFTEKGFVFSSFDGKEKILLPLNQSETISAKKILSQQKETINIGLSAQVSDKIEFESLVARAIKEISNNEFKKVVVSRKETHELVDFDPILAFEKLVDLYPSTFVYCFFHPSVGTWLGATPELLLKSEENEFETIALAGTQKDKGLAEVFWPKKEQEEQQYVTDYIVDILKNVTSNVKVSTPFSVKAGNIWHIKTTIQGKLESSFDLQNVIQLLHPTPAVCGLPKEKAKAFILENENYNRTFYTGFLGELNIDAKTDLFVNLRSMEIEFDPNLEITKAHLFMGCGITKDSNPEKEWEESVNKSVTIKKILDCRV